MSNAKAVLVQKEFDDFDEFTAEVRGWNLDFKQLDRGHFQAQLTQLVTPRFQLGRARFRRRLHQTGLSPVGLRTFVVPAHPRMRLFWRGNHLTGDDLMAFPENGELDSVSESDFDVFTVSLPLEVLGEAADLMGGANARKPLFNEETRHCDTTAMRALRRRLTEIQRTLQESPAQVDGPLPVSAQELAQLIANTWLGAKDNGWKQSRLSRARVIHAALDHIHHAPPDDLTVASLCRIVGTSERTLQYCFQERFGLSPKQYLQTWRLNGVRRVLRQSDPRTTKVADVANHWGFWHMGQFAADYRKLFYELPSETLRTA